MVYQYPAKSYLHFDKITKFNSKVETYVEGFEKKPTHSFLPLIYSNLNFDTYKKINLNSNDNKVRNGKVVPVKEKKRPIMYASHIDNFIYKHYGIQLNNFYNSYAVGHGFDASSIAYRNNKEGKNNIHFAAEVINFIVNNPNCYVYVGDYSSFFDTLEHNYLKKMINYLYKERMPDHQYKIYKSLTKYSYVNKEDITYKLGEDSKLVEKGNKRYFNNSKEFRNFKKQSSVVGDNNNQVLKTNTCNIGIPQGTAMSAVYSNIYMIEIDEYISKNVKDLNGMYRRYSDDYIVIFPHITLSNFNDIKCKIEKKIKNAKLKINLKKTQIMKFEKNELIDLESNKKTSLDYLGFVFDGRRVQIREKSIYKYYRHAYKLVNRGEVISRKKNHIGINARLTYKRKIYQKYHQFGERTDIKYNYKKRKYGTFITYVNKSKKIFDRLSPNTLNLMKKQIANHQKKLNRKIIQSVKRLKKI